MTTKKTNAKWEIIFNADGQPWVSRMAVPGGWLYHVQGYNHPNETTVFVPAPTKLER